jgi:hypothetical protein
MPKQSVRSYSRKRKQKGGANEVEPLPTYIPVDGDLISKAIWFPQGLSIRIDTFTLSYTPGDAPYSVLIRDEDTYKRALESIDEKQAVVKKLTDKVFFTTEFEKWQKYYAEQKRTITDELNQIKIKQASIAAKVKALQESPVDFPPTREEAQKQVNEILSEGTSQYGVAQWSEYNDMEQQYEKIRSGNDYPSKEGQLKEIQEGMERIKQNYTKFLIDTLLLISNDLDGAAAYKQEELDRSIAQYNQEYGKQWIGWQRYTLALLENVKNLKRDIKHYLLTIVLKNLNSVIDSNWTSYKDEKRPILDAISVRTKEYETKYPEIEKFIKIERDAFTAAQSEWDKINKTFEKDTPLLEWDIFKPSSYFEPLNPYFLEERNIGLQLMTNILVPIDVQVQNMFNQYNQYRWEHKQAEQRGDYDEANRLWPLIGQSWQSYKALQYQAYSQDSIIAQQAGEFTQKRELLKKAIDNMIFDRISGTPQKRAERLRYFHSKYSEWKDTDISYLTKTETEMLAELQKEAEDSVKKSQAELALKLQGVQSKVQDYLKKQHNDMVAEQAKKKAKENARISKLKKEQEEWEAQRLAAKLKREQEEAAIQAELLRSQQEQQRYVIAQQEALKQKLQALEKVSSDLQTTYNSFVDSLNQYKKFQQVLPTFFTEAETYFTNYKQVTSQIDSFAKQLEENAKTIDVAKNENASLFVFNATLKGYKDIFDTYKQSITLLDSDVKEKLAKYSPSEEILKQYTNDLTNKLVTAQNASKLDEVLNELTRETKEATTILSNIQNDLVDASTKENALRYLQTSAQTADAGIQDIVKKVNTMLQDYGTEKQAFLQMNIEIKKQTFSSGITSIGSISQSQTDLVNEIIEKANELSERISSIVSNEMDISELTSEDGKALYPELVKEIEKAKQKKGELVSLVKESKDEVLKSSEASSQLSGLSARLQSMDSTNKEVYRQALNQIIDQMAPLQESVNKYSDILQNNKRKVVSMKDEITEISEKATQFVNLIKKAEADFKLEQQKAMEAQTPPVPVVSTPVPVVTTPVPVVTTPVPVVTTPVYESPPVYSSVPVTTPPTPAPVYMPPPPVSSSAPNMISRESITTAPAPVETAPAPAETPSAPVETAPAPVETAPAFTLPAPTTNVKEVVQQANVAITNAKVANTKEAKQEAKVAVQNAKQEIQKTIQTNKATIQTAQNVASQAKELDTKLQQIAKKENIPELTNLSKLAQSLHEDAENTAQGLTAENENLENEEESLENENANLEENENQEEEEEEVVNEEEEEEVVNEEEEEENNQQGGARHQTRRKKRKTNSHTKRKHRGSKK